MVFFPKHFLEKLNLAQFFRIYTLDVCSIIRSSTLNIVVPRNNANCNYVIQFVWIVQP